MPTASALTAPLSLAMGIALMRRLTPGADSAPG